MAAVRRLHLIQTRQILPKIPCFECPGPSNTQMLQRLLPQWVYNVFRRQPKDAGNNSKIILIIIPKSPVNQERNEINTQNHTRTSTKMGVGNKENLRAIVQRSQQASHVVRRIMKFNNRNPLRITTSAPYTIVNR